jgi:hypothetical protein
MLAFLQCLSCNAFPAMPFLQCVLSGPALLTPTVWNVLGMAAGTARQVGYMHEGFTGQGCVGIALWALHGLCATDTIKAFNMSAAPACWHGVVVGSYADQLMVWSLLALCA